MSFEEGFVGKKILITGASRGIGRALAIRLYKIGISKIYAVARSENDLKSLEKECPGIVTGITVDLLDWNGTRDALKDIEPVDYLVNGAGINKVEPFLKIQPESFDRVMGLNCKGVINVSQIVAEKMIESKIHGSIVNISSVSAKQTFPMRGVYCASKIALDSITRHMARELGPHQIRVNGLNPAGVDTFILRDAIQQAENLGVKNALPDATRYPMGITMIEMNQIENSILFLLSSKLAPMITGVSLLIDGGLCVT